MPSNADPEGGMHADGPTIIQDDAPPLTARLEAVMWGLVCRVAVRFLRLDRTVAILDRLPHAGTADEIVRIPTSRRFRGSGACLSRSLARSQYLRVRGVPSTIAIGAKGSIADFDAHAWLEPMDEGDRPVLHRVPR